MLRTLRNFACLTAAASLAFAPTANACTSFLIKTKNGDPIYGRTMEYAVPLKSEIVVVPRGYEYEAATESGKGGWTWKAKYAATGMNAVDTPFIVDGMNEKGLTGGMLYFPGYVGYVPADKADAEKAMGPWQFLSWALTNFATTDEVKKALANIQLADFPLPFKIGSVTSLPLHYTLHDTDGNSIVIEPVDGKLKVYDNPLGVMTNAPGFDWHLTNLKNYVKLSPVNVPPLKIDGESIASFGQGSGMLGVPGDPTPPSRFIRALGYAISAQVQPDTDSGVRMAEHIVNNFDIPAGFVQEGKGVNEITEWSTVADMTGLRYYFKTEDYQALREVDLKDFDLDAKEMVSIPVDQSYEIPKLEMPRS
ncbi:choloylglycine hydrolase family protein [Methyloligella sp. 2.7D]|uniref:linear amide C-N hydrolase n=1 Tax=unclassified Methyloligella TaxID=2625955 RepID=UPI00157C774E|nr:choloylglycine hydrolase family protein [Methyloligella sp. GL2]QKP76299.1 choloylglycine hydrolase family protein [Methyloligella sp. GL2]